MNDRFGEYFYLTGLECPTVCFWCGTDVKGARRYCSNEHRQLYTESFHWPEASLVCRQRSPNCANCGQVFKSLLVGEVHHIIPLRGNLRLWNVLNRQENLQRLCLRCHATTRIKPKLTLEPKPSAFEVALERGQMVMELGV